MSDHLAIGGVSLTLKALLDDRMEFTRAALPPNDKVTVTISAPDVAQPTITGPRFNLFMYHIAENGALKNQEIPGQGHPGDYGHPPLSLDLFYLCTAYGSIETNDVQAHRILGDAMRVLHDFPLITESLLRERTPGSIPVLDTDLVGEFEKIKITLYSMPVEESFKIWSSLPDTNFRCSVAYQVSVVQIESRRQRAQTLPVRERRVYALPFRSPQITEIYRDPPPPLVNVKSAVAAAGDTLKIVGVNLASTTTRVMLGTENATIITQRDQELTVQVPATLPSGAHPAQVIQDVMLETVTGQPPVAHLGYRSNVVAFLMIPTINSILPGAGAGPGDVVTVNVTPLMRPTQQAVLLLDDFAISADPVAPTTPPSATVQFRLPTGTAALPAKPDYLARIRIDGAESRLSVNPATRRYDGPTYNVTP
jgi:Pvc16 N-terminal domain/IPT/TIG domain